MTRTSSRCLYNQAGTLQIGYKLQTVVDSLFVSFPIDAFDLDRPASKRQELARPELFGAGFQHPASAWRLFVREFIFHSQTVAILLTSEIEHRASRERNGNRSQFRSLSQGFQSNLRGCHGECGHRQA